METIFSPAKHKNRNSYLTQVYCDNHQVVLKLFLTKNGKPWTIDYSACTALHGCLERTLSNPNSKVHLLKKNCTEYFTKNTILFFQKSKLTDVRHVCGSCLFHFLCTCDVISLVFLWSITYNIQNPIALIFNIYTVCC